MRFVVLAMVVFFIAGCTQTNIELSKTEDVKVAEKVTDNESSDRDELIRECTLACACTRADIPAAISACENWCLQHVFYGGIKRLPERTAERWADCELSSEEVEQLAKE